MGMPRILYLFSQITLNCCAPSGITLDTQEVHSKESYAYGMYQMTRCRSYAAIDFSTVFDPENYAEMEVSEWAGSIISFNILLST